MTEIEWFELLQKKYVQRADDRQKAMGLVYMEAETHDLARTIAQVNPAPAAAQAGLSEKQIVAAQEVFEKWFCEDLGLDMEADESKRIIEKMLQAALSRAPATQQSEQLAPKLAQASELDWPEDANHENGNYQCKCVSCGEFFIGHKRRGLCKLCATQSAQPAEPSGDERAAMPPCDDRRPYDPNEPDGYFESDREWIERNLLAVRWFIDNHASIRAAQSGQRAAVPKGWKPVPLKPTTEMLRMLGFPEGAGEAFYANMLAIAPAPAAQTQAEGPKCP